MKDGTDTTVKAKKLVAFRQAFYSCLPKWSDALFELCDAALNARGPVGSTPLLSLESVFRRSHGSLYKALMHGEVNVDALRQLLVEHRPEGWPPVFAVDASTWARCDAECSPERGFYYSASKHSAGKPIVAGWSYQWITQLDWVPDSWTAPLDALRLPLDASSTVTTIEQVKSLVDRLGADGDVPMFVFDAGYDAIALSDGLKDTRAQVLVRIRSDRVFYDEPLQRETAVGRPRRHGKRFSCADPATQRKPDATLQAHDSRYGKVKVRVWNNLHPKLADRGYWENRQVLPIVNGTVIRVDVERLPKPSSKNKTLWLWWSGDGDPDLDIIWRAYLRRFDIEHTYRFVKNTLGWTTPGICTPEQADKWTWLVVSAYTQLRLARGLVEDLRLPWERQLSPERLTPARVRRGFCRLGKTIGTPASPPKTYRPGPGRPKGTKTGPRTRYPAVKKATSGV